MIRSLYTKAYWLARNPGAIWRHRHLKGVIFYGGNSLGDDLLCGALAREIVAHETGPVGMMTRYPDLFSANPYVTACIPFDLGLLESFRHAGKKMWRPTYTNERTTPFFPEQTPSHVLVQMCRSCGLPDPTSLSLVAPAPPAPTSETYRAALGAIVVQSGNRGASHHYPGKEWGAEKFQTVVDHLRRSFTVVQVGSPNDVLLTGAHDLRGKTPLADLIQIFHAMHFFIGLEGFYMHLARSVGKRSVIVYGGRVSPHSFGYADNINLTAPLDPSLTGLTDLDSAEAAAMSKISPAAVIAAASTIANHAGGES